MTKREIVEEAVLTICRKGVGYSTAAPPIFRILWKLGIHVPPPMFMSFGTCLIGFGVPFGVLFSLASNWFLGLGELPGSSVITLLIAAFNGMFFGTAMGFYYTRRARRLELGSWAEFVAAHQDNEPT